jgi:hypothetical protein
LLVEQMESMGKEMQDVIRCWMKFTPYQPDQYAGAQCID